MLALRIDPSGVRVADVPPPAPRPGYATLDVALAGICNTDLEIARGYMGFSGTLGHEVVGTVCDGPAEWLGVRAVAEINFGCGACGACARGLSRHCPTRTVMGILGADGAIAEQVIVPVANLHRVPDGVPDEAAVFAEPLAAAFEIPAEIAIERGCRALVLGDGKLGLLAALVLQQAGADVLAVGKHEAKLGILRRAGIATSLSPTEGGFDVVVEATGSAGGFATAVAMTRPRGTLVLKSTVADRPNVDLAPVVIHEIRVQGSRCGPFPPAIDALARGSIDVSPLVSGRYALEDAALALERAKAPGVLKVLVGAR